MKKVKSTLITVLILAAMALLCYAYYRYTNYYYGEQFYKNCTISTKADSYTFSERDSITIPVTVKNRSRVSFTKSNNYYLSYHLYDDSGKVIDADGERTELEIRPFRSGTISMKVAAAKPGTYKVVIDAVREGYYWHEDLGGKTATVSVTIK